MNTENGTEDRLKEIFELTRLYDVYGQLLNEHLREVFEDYVLNNYSLGEIADELDLSRQGVRDLVVRSSKKLRGFEDGLGFVKKIDDVDRGLESLAEMLKGDRPDTEGAIRLINEIRGSLEI